MEVLLPQRRTSNGNIKKLYQQALTAGMHNKYIATG
jgi:hypothetical protein